MHSGWPVRVGASEARAVPAGRAEATGRGGPGGFPGVLERAGDAALDALLARMIAPDRAPSLPLEAASRAAGSPLLAQAVERIVLLVKSGATPSVTLQLGRSLDVRIDQARAGVEVTIRAVHGLSPLAEGELPMLVASLRARGIRVARAGVLGRRGRGSRSLTGSRSSATTAGDDGTVAKW